MLSVSVPYFLSKLKQCLESLQKYYQQNRNDKCECENKKENKKTIFTLVVIVIFPLDHKSQRV